MRKRSASKSPSPPKPRSFRQKEEKTKGYVKVGSRWAEIVEMAKVKMGYLAVVRARNKSGTLRDGHQVVLVDPEAIVKSLTDLAKKEEKYKEGWFVTAEGRIHFVRRIAEVGSYRGFTHYAWRQLDGSHVSSWSEESIFPSYGLAEKAAAGRQATCLENAIERVKTQKRVKFENRREYLTTMRYLKGKVSK